MYLITAKYNSDSERKRIEYALDKWGEHMNVIKPEGVVVMVDSEDIDRLIMELYSRTDRQNVNLYHIKKASLDVTEEEKELSLKLDENRETVEKLLDFIMARQKAILKMESIEPRQKIYEVYTRKGKAEISINIHEYDHGVNLRLQVSGYGEAVDLLYRKLAEELNLLKGGK